MVAREGDGGVGVASGKFCFYNDAAPTEIYTLSLHDALPIWPQNTSSFALSSTSSITGTKICSGSRSEEHTSELQSRLQLVCRLLLEKKNTQHYLTDCAWHRHSVLMCFFLSYHYLNRRDLSVR